MFKISIFTHLFFIQIFQAYYRWRPYCKRWTHPNFVQVKLRYRDRTLASLQAATGAPPVKQVSHVIIWANLVSLIKVINCNSIKITLIQCADTEMSNSDPNHFFVPDCKHVYFNCEISFFFKRYWWQPPVDTWWTAVFSISAKAFYISD